MNGNNINKGDKIKFKSEVQQYTVRIANMQYVICSKPFNARKGYLYSIIDFRENIRGGHNMIFNCYEYTDRGFREMFADLARKKIEISHRTRMDLDIERIILYTL